MPRHIKRAALAGQTEQADAKVRGTVETIIADVAKRGDAAVRELSERFDKWSPPSFRLSQDEIAALVAKVAPQTIDDIRFAQTQIRNFAEIQRAAESNPIDKVLNNWTVGTDPAPHINAVQKVLDAGAVPFLHFAQEDPITAIDFYRTDVLPKLR